MPPVLLSRTLDPLLGVFTGIFAYHLYETNPRTAIAEEDRLTPLLRWKYARWQNERQRRLSADEEVDLGTIRAEVEKA
ncbi:hypothetical protein WOLCODRAFT_22999 [Wolfiporia cocos MD-104 SS10]|uniref:Uncharacterized protein n=1 Tax=Wolfiporia cocos (strain MD-104) TaxID=742152 RepID=A0A2H3JJQ5_WOLCO|nr:hypothetical protein WOLCODRAFT_22999 [Wolfiporia cocos MD-104 SS10]